MILTQINNGGEYHGGIGLHITVRLEENPTTGYRWGIDRADGLDLIYDSYERSGDTIGAAGYRIFTFDIISAGSHELRMKNWRKWEGDSSIIDRATLPRRDPEELGGVHRTGWERGGRVDQLLQRRAKRDPGRGSEGLLGRILTTFRAGSLGPALPHVDRSPPRAVPQPTFPAMCPLREPSAYLWSQYALFTCLLTKSLCAT